MNVLLLTLGLTLAGDAAKAFYDALKLPELTEETVSTKAFSGDASVACTRKKCTLDGLASVKGEAAKRLYDALPEGSKRERRFKGKITLKCTYGIAPKDSYECDVTF